MVALAQRVNIVMKLRHGHHIRLCGLPHEGERTSRKEFLLNHAFQNQVQRAAFPLPSTLFHSRVFPFNLSHKNTLARAQTFFRHPSCSDSLSLPSDLPGTPPLKPPTSQSKEISRPASLRDNLHGTLCFNIISPHLCSEANGAVVEYLFQNPT